MTGIVSDVVGAGLQVWNAFEANKSKKRKKEQKKFDQAALKYSEEIFKYNKKLLENESELNPARQELKRKQLQDDLKKINDRFKIEEKELTNTLKNIDTAQSQKELDDVHIKTNRDLEYQAQEQQVRNKIENAKREAITDPLKYQALQKELENDIANLEEKGKLDPQRWENEKLNVENIRADLQNYQNQQGKRFENQAANLENEGKRIGYEGEYNAQTAKLNTQKSSLIDELLGSLKGEGPYADLFSTDKDLFDRSVVQPALHRYNTQVAPAINEKAAANGTLFNSATQDYHTRAGVDLNMLLAEQEGDWARGKEKNKMTWMDSILNKNQGFQGQNSNPNGDYGNNFTPGINGSGNPNSGPITQPGQNQAVDNSNKYSNVNTKSDVNGLQQPTPPGGSPYKNPSDLNTGLGAVAGVGSSEWFADLMDKYTNGQNKPNDSTGQPIQKGFERDWDTWNRNNTSMNRSY